MALSLYAHLITDYQDFKVSGLNPTGTFFCVGRMLTLTDVKKGLGRLQMMKNDLGFSAVIK